MCRPSEYPPFEKICGHALNRWCACTKYGSIDGNEYLGDQPANAETRMLRPADASRGYHGTLGISKGPRVDESPDSDSDRQLGLYGELNVR